MSEEARREFFLNLRADIKSFSRTVSKIGYNALILDDVFHLTDHPSYDDRTRKQISFYKKEFEHLLAIIRDEGLRIFLTMDLLYSVPAVRGRKWSSAKKRNQFAADLLPRFLREFPEVSGVLLHFTNSRDSSTAVPSLWNRRSLNHFLRSVLPVFDSHNRLCILRTWSPGKRPGCDLIWKNAAISRTLEGITSKALILSFRHSETGFFRFTTVNRNFFATEFPAIVELQARREHEGCGEFPSFVGYQSEKLAHQLKNVPHIAGISVSCQTGGRSAFGRLAFLDENAIWTEINAFVMLRLFKYGESVEEAISRLPNVNNPMPLLELLRLSEEVVRELLYVPEFAACRFYLRRRRLPPLIGVYHDHLLVSASIKRLFQYAVSQPDSAIRSGETALTHIRRMKMLALQCHLPESDIELMESTFDTLAFSRDYYFRPDSKVIRDDLEASVKRYRSKYHRNGVRRRFAVKLDLDPMPLNRRFIVLFSQWIWAKKPGFRVIDEMIKLRILSLFSRFLRRSRPTWTPTIGE